MPILEIIAAILGLGLSAFSLLLYYRRTNDREWASRLWFGKKLLTWPEYLLSRVGFTIAVVAVVRIWIDVAAIVYVHD